MDPRTLALLLMALFIPASAAGAANYCVVASRKTHDDPQWRAVVDALRDKHQAEVVVFDRSVVEALTPLRQQFPRYVCFVARPSEAGRQFVADVCRLARRLDDDPYTDALWGILTGFDAADALRVAQHDEPLVIHRVAAGTEIELNACREGVWYSELEQGRMVRKRPGGRPVAEKGPDDTTHALAEALAKYRAQLFVTSGHATERNWQIGFRYRNGYFQSQGGELFGLDTEKNRFSIRSENPKVYLPVGNCLMGHIDGPDAMALAFMHRAGVYQMIGYTVPTWYGYGGWGLLDYFVEQPGRFTLAEAYYANQQALVHRAATYFPDLDLAAPSEARGATGERARKAGLTAQDAAGLAYDSATVAFYGDPAWSAKMAPGEKAWDQTLTERGGKFCLEIRPNLGERSFEPINTNGSQRGGRPIFQLLPRRIAAQEVKILEGAELNPLVTDNFILVPLPEKCDPERVYRVVFQAPPL